MKNTQLKFRAWHEKLNRMFSAEEMVRDQMALLPDGRFCNVHGDDTSKSTFPPMTPMQFTTLLDKNGKEIYADDIVKISYDFIVDEEDNEVLRNYVTGVVSWNDHSTGWVIKCKSPMSVTPDGLVMTSIIHGPAVEREIIGNVHQNPELL